MDLSLSPPDHVYAVRPTQINRIENLVPGTSTEMAMALKMKGISETPLIHKTMIHDGSCVYMSATNFIRSEIAAGNVRRATRIWLDEILKSAL